MFDFDGSKLCANPIITASCTVSPPSPRSVPRLPFDSLILHTFKISMTFRGSRHWTRFNTHGIKRLQLFIAPLPLGSTPRLISLPAYVIFTDAANRLVALHGSGVRCGNAHAEPLHPPGISAACSFSPGVPLTYCAKWPCRCSTTYVQPNYLPYGAATTDGRKVLVGLFFQKVMCVACLLCPDPIILHFYGTLCSCYEFIRLGFDMADTQFHSIVAC